MCASGLLLYLVLYFNSLPSIGLIFPRCFFILSLFFLSSLELLLLFTSLIYFCTFRHTLRYKIEPLYCEFWLLVFYFYLFFLLPKIWDLAAGKILAEFNEHSAPVTDLTFHPNELLLTSSSMDGTVKFWDLETFSLVSATTNEAGPMHKIIYNTEGTILYSAARDLLKAYQWEPSRTLDTFVLNWGRVRDLAIDCNSHLLSASCNLMTMALFFIDLSGGKKTFANLTSDALNSLSNSFSTNLTLTSSISNTNLHSISSIKNTCSNLLSSPSLNNLASINDTSPLTISNNGNNGSSFFQSYPLPMPTRLPPIANATKVHNTNTNGSNSTNSNNNNLKLSNKVSKNNYTNQQNGNGSQLVSHQILHQSHLHPSTLVPNGNSTLGVNLKAPSTSSSTNSSSSNCEVSSASVRQTKSSLVFLEPHATCKGISSSNGHSSSQMNNKTNCTPAIVSSSPMVAVTSIQQQLKKDQIDSSIPLSLELFPATGKDLHLRDESNLKGNSQHQSASGHTYWSRLPPHIPSLAVPPDNSSVTKCETNKPSNTSTSNTVVAIALDSSNNGTTANNSVNTLGKVPSACTATTTVSQGKAAAIVFPEPQRQSVKCKSIGRNNSREDDLVDELIPETRDCPAGLDIDEFLPKHLQDTVRLGLHPAPEISETEAMTSIMRGHKSLVTALSHRKKNIQIILALWTSKDSIKALEQAVQLDDQSVIVDILNVINLKP